MAPLAERVVRIRADTRGFSAELRRQLRADTGIRRAGLEAGSAWGKAFNKAAAATLKSAATPVKVPVDVDTDGLKRLPKTRLPKVPVELDPLVAAFQAEVRKQTAALSKQVSATVPVRPDAADLRQDLADKIRTVQNQLKVKVPAGPDARTFETDLRALVREVESQVRLSLPVQAAGAVEAGRAAARVAEKAAPAIKLRVDGSGAEGSLAGLTRGFAGLAHFIGLEGIANGLRVLTGAAGNAGTAVTNLSTNIFAWIPALLTAGAALATLPLVAGAATAAIYALAGAIASLPALTLGVGAGIGVLGLGFAGLADHFKDTAKGGGGAAKSMAGLRAATKAVTTANRELLKAQQAVNKAREDEIERVSDLNRELRRSELDVLRAQQNLNAAQRGDDPLAIREALLDLEDAQDKVGDLAAEKAKADRDGVEGSDQVQDALVRQRDATERLAEAQLALAEAQKSAGGGGGAGKELMKLAPAAAEVVAAIKGLKPAFEDLRLSVQQRLFAGVAGEIKAIAAVWLPALKVSLGDMAGTFNRVFKVFSATIREPKFIADIQAGLESMRVLFERVGVAIAGPFTRALGTLSRAAAPFVTMLGDKLVGLIERFSRAVDRADKDGGLARFFTRASQAFSDLWSIGGSVLSIFTSLFQIFTGSNLGESSDRIFGGLKDSLASAAAWLKDPANQERVRGWIDSMSQLLTKFLDFARWVKDEGIPTVQTWITKIDGWIGQIQRWSTIIGAVSSTLSGGLGGLGAGANAAVGAVSSALGRIPGMIRALGPQIVAATPWGGLVESFRTALNNIIALWNRLTLNIAASGSKALGGMIGGSGLGTISVSGRGKFLAAGGVVQARPGGMHAVIGEGGEAEAVAPLSTLTGMIRDAVTSAGGGGGDIIIPLSLFPGAEVLDTVVVTALHRNPTAVAKANALGARRRAYVG